MSNWQMEPLSHCWLDGKREWLAKTVFSIWYWFFQLDKTVKIARNCEKYISFVISVSFQRLYNPCTNITLCSSIWKTMVSRMREAGETMLSVCSAWVSQLMKSCKELWKSVASLSASSSLTCETDHQHGNNQAVFAATCGRAYQAENKLLGCYNTR